MGITMIMAGRGIRTPTIRTGPASAIPRRRTEAA
jgi:hypothetical protein